MTPPTTRTWARRGHTPLIRVRGRSQRRFSIAALACYKDEHDGGTGLLMGGDEQVAVVGPGETASAAPLVIDVPLGPVDQA
jgi:alanine dehydrogenase